MKNKYLYLLPLLFLAVPFAAFADPIPLPILNTSFSDNFLGSLYVFAMYLAIAIVCELLIGYIFCLVTKTPKRILLWIILANLISFPIFSLLLTPALITFGFFSIFFLEALVIVFEAFFIYYFNKQYISLNKSMILSIIMNIFSLVVPLMAYLVYYQMYYSTRANF